VLDALQSDTTMFAFDERQNVKLTAPVAVDITQPGTYDERDDLTQGTIPAGSVVRSHLVHSDAVVDRRELEATIVTDSDIIGIAIDSNTLDGSDFLGNPGTVYPTGFGPRQLALDSPRQNDFVIQQIDRRTLVVHLSTGPHLDQVRVITVGTPGGTQGCTPGYWKQSHHFDSWQGYSPGDSFETVFGVNAFAGDPTLVQVLGTGGGGVSALGRHAVAALLNARHGGVDSAFTPQQVIDMTRNAILSGSSTQIESTKNALAAANERRCPLN
jgi:hypothetical protein